MWEPQGFYSSFLLRQPNILFGENAFRGLFNLPSSKIAIIHGSGLQETDFIQIRQNLKANEIKFIKKSWKGEPILCELTGTVAELENFRPDVIIAIGGGSVIDGVKIARLLYEFPFINPNNPKFGFLEWKTRFIAVPTTVGSGAEISSAAVLIDPLNRCKSMIVNHALQPSVILFYPQFIAHSPQTLIISSSIDAIAHILEGYVSVIKNDLADIIAEKGLQIFKEELSKEEWSTIDFLRLQYGGYLGGITQNHCIVGAAHAIAHQLATYGYSHSEAISLLLPSVIELNSSIDCIRQQYENIAIRAGFINSHSLILWLINLRNKTNYSHTRLNETKKLLAKLIEEESFIRNLITDKGGKGNPIPLNKEYILNLIQIL